MLIIITIFINKMVTFEVMQTHSSHFWNCFTYGNSCENHEVMDTYKKSTKCSIIYNIKFTFGILRGYISITNLHFEGWNLYPHIFMLYSNRNR